MVVWAEFFVEYEFDSVAFPVCVCNQWFTFQIVCRLV
ncbi:hypothetical protein ATJ93_2513 [Halopiger aswanensis]|uniref:Uncharacterized protein n=1 Tax=Halopiger aswanensis TaxID=148449 RepID=A0A3R7GWF1_9EURY|nr:hypothetical protein ATJ93_2513 [Halopiger aswanensis]